MIYIYQNKESIKYDDYKKIIICTFKRKLHKYEEATMSNKPVNQNAKEALNQMKLEIANELGIQSNTIDGASNTSYKNGEIGGHVGGAMSRKLVEMGERELLRRYSKDKI